ASSVGPTRFTPIRPTSSGARARASSSVTMKCSTAPAPRPPYSSGQATPTHRPSASFACQSRPNATSSPRSSKWGGRPLPYSHGRCSRSHVRTSARSSASASVGSRSIHSHFVAVAGSGCAATVGKAAVAAGGYRGRALASVPGGAMAGTEEQVRVGFFPTTGPVGDAGDSAAYLARAHDAGIDHVCCGDHVSFFVGVGLDGLIQATTLAMLHPTLPVMTGVYLLPLRHPVLVARQLSDLDQLAPGRLV